MRTEATAGAERAHRRAEGCGRAGRGYLFESGDGAGDRAGSGRETAAADSAAERPCGRGTAARFRRRAGATATACSYTDISASALRVMS